MQRIHFVCCRSAQTCLVSPLRSLARSHTAPQVFVWRSEQGLQPHRMFFRAFDSWEASEPLLHPSSMVPDVTALPCLHQLAAHQRAARCALPQPPARPPLTRPRHSLAPPACLPPRAAPVWLCAGRKRNGKNAHLHYMATGGEDQVGHHPLKTMMEVMLWGDAEHKAAKADLKLW